MTSARQLVGGVGVVVAVGLTACGSSSPSSGVQGASTSSSSSSSSGAGAAGVNLGSPTVQISATDALKFVPTEQTAHVGDVIQWTNTASVTHTVTFDSFPSLSDPTLSSGGTWEVKFNAAGTYAYHCTIHAGMTGTLTVS